MSKILERRIRVRYNLCNGEDTELSSHLVREDRVGDLRGSTDEIDLEELRLEVRVLGEVVLEGFEEEAGGLLDPVGGEEGLSGGLEVD